MERHEDFSYVEQYEGREVDCTVCISQSAGHHREPGFGVLVTPASSASYNLFFHVCISSLTCHPTCSIGGKGYLWVLFFKIQNIDGVYTGLGTRPGFSTYTHSFWDFSDREWDEDYSRKLWNLSPFTIEGQWQKRNHNFYVTQTLSIAFYTPFEFWFAKHIWGLIFLVTNVFSSWSQLVGCCDI